jgi:Na+-driven multidrug efflux pump
VVPTALTMLAIGGVEIPAAWLLSQHYGLNGIWMGYPIAFTAMLLMQTAYYRLVWKKKPIQRL